MRATGIVRRIDELGRVVIPKEIRRTLRIREGDPLEIYTDRDGDERQGKGGNQRTHRLFVLVRHPGEGRDPT